jgi:hypothetical protein
MPCLSCISLNKIHEQISTSEKISYSNITIVPHQSYIPLAWTQEKGKELEEDDNLTEDVKLRRRSLLTRFDPAADSHPSRHRSSRREVQFEP